MRLLLTLSLLGPAALVNGQQCDWLISAPITYTSNPSMANEVLASAPGMLISARQNSGVFVYGQNLYGEAVIERRDHVSGEQLWWCPLFDSVNVQSAVVSADGLAYFAGRFMGELAICDGSVLAGVPGEHPWNENSFLIAVDLNEGAFLWTRNLSLEHTESSGVPSLAIDPNGDLWYTTMEWGVGKVVRVNEQGADVETRVIDGVRFQGSISFDPWGGLYVSGAASDEGFAFGGQSYQDYNTSGYTMFVLRYRPDGTAGFVQFGTDITFQDPMVVATSDGHAYLAGSLMDSTQWGDITFDGPPWGMSVFLTKLDSTGHFIWGVNSAQPDGPIVGDMDRAKGSCIAVDAADNVYLHGTVRGVVDWGDAVVSGSGEPTARSLSVVAFDPDGTPRWAANSAPMVTGFAEARAVTAQADASVHFAGHIRDAFTFAPYSTNDNGTQAAMFGRLNGLTTSIASSEMRVDLDLAPNPVTDRFTVQWPADGTNAELLNGMGQRVRMVRLNTGSNTVDVEDLAAGPYVLRTALGTARVVKQ